MSNTLGAVARAIQSEGPPSLRARPARTGDGIAIAAALRSADARELSAAGCNDPAESMETAIKHGGVTLCGVDAEDQPLLIFGTARHCTPEPWGLSASVWMLAREGVEKHARQIARESRQWAQRLISFHGPGVCGHNHVDARNALHIRWLQWCGARFTGNAIFPTSPELPFFEFYIPPCANQQR